MNPKKFNKWVERICKKLQIGVANSLTLHIGILDEWVQVNIREHAKDVYIARTHLEDLLQNEKFGVGYGWIIMEDGFHLYRDNWHLEKGEE